MDRARSVAFQEILTNDDLHATESAYLLSEEEAKGKELSEAAETDPGCSTDSDPEYDDETVDVSPRRDGLTWHAQVVPDNFHHEHFTVTPGQLTPCRGFPHITVSDLEARLQKIVEENERRGSSESQKSQSPRQQKTSWVLEGELNGWSSLVNLQLRGITKRYTKMGRPAIKRLWKHTQDGDPREVLRKQASSMPKSLRATFHAPPSTSLGWSPNSPGFSMWYDPYAAGGPRLLHGSAMVDEALPVTAERVHMFAHRYAMQEEKIKDRLSYHAALLIEWSHGRCATVVELAWWNGLGGYSGRSNWCHDMRAKGTTKLFAAMPPELKGPWQSSRAEIRFVDTPCQNLKEFEAYLRHYSDKGPLPVLQQRFFDPQIAASGAVRLSYSRHAHVLQYTLNYINANGAYSQSTRNCQTFAADFFSFLTGQKDKQPFTAGLRVLYKPRLMDFLYDCDVQDSG